MIASSNILSRTERREIARSAAIPAKHWRAWRQARAVCVLLMAFDPEGETERIKKQLSMEVGNAARSE